MWGWEYELGSFRLGILDALEEGHSLIGKLDRISVFVFGPRARQMPDGIV